MTFISFSERMDPEQIHATLTDPDFTELSNFCIGLEHNATIQLKLDLSSGSNDVDSGYSYEGSTHDHFSDATSTVPSSERDEHCDPRYCATPTDFSDACSPSQSCISEWDNVSQYSHVSACSTRNTEFEFLFGSYCSEDCSSRRNTPWDAISYPGTPSTSSVEWINETMIAGVDRKTSYCISPDFCSKMPSSDDTQSTSTSFSRSKRRLPTSKTRSALEESVILIDEMQEMSILCENNADQLNTTEECENIGKKRTSAWHFPRSLAARRQSGEQCSRTMPLTIKRIWNKKSLAEQRKLQKLLSVEDEEVRFEKKKESERNRLKYEKMKGEFPCQEKDCKYVAKWRKHLNVHIRRVHDEEKSFQCPIDNCEQRFFLSTELNAHFLTHGHTRKRKLNSRSDEPLRHLYLKRLCSNDKKKKVR